MQLLFKKGLFKLSKAQLCMFFILPVMLFSKHSGLIGYVLLFLQLFYLVSLIYVVLVSPNVANLSSTPIFLAEGVVFILGLSLSTFSNLIGLSEEILNSIFIDILSLLTLFLSFDFINRALKVIHPSYQSKGVFRKLFCIFAAALFPSGVFYLKELLEGRIK